MNQAGLAFCHLWPMARHHISSVPMHLFRSNVLRSLSLLTLLTVVDPHALCFYPQGLFLGGSELDNANLPPLASDNDHMSGHGALLGHGDVRLSPDELGDEDDDPLAPQHVPLSPLQLPTRTPLSLSSDGEPRAKRSKNYGGRMHAASGAAAGEPEHMTAAMAAEAVSSAEAANGHGAGAFPANDVYAAHGYHQGHGPYPTLLHPSHYHHASLGLGMPRYAHDDLGMNGMLYSGGQQHHHNGSAGGQYYPYHGGVGTADGDGNGDGDGDTLEPAAGGPLSYETYQEPLLGCHICSAVFLDMSSLNAHRLYEHVLMGNRVDSWDAAVDALPPPRPRPPPAPASAASYTASNPPPLAATSHASVAAAPCHTSKTSSAPKSRSTDRIVMVDQTTGRLVAGMAAPSREVNL